MGFLFGKQKATQGSDPWATMPKWMKQAYKKDTKFREELLGDATQISDALTQDPREILQLNELERLGLTSGVEGLNQAGGLNQQAAGAAGGMGELADYLRGVLGSNLSGAAAGLTGQAEGKVGGIEGSIGNTQSILNSISPQLAQALGFASDTGLSDAARTAAMGANTDVGRGPDLGLDIGLDIDSLLQKYRSGYTDDVVDTTLAGMDRQAQREALARESKNASIGGTSNTRTQVGHEIANQLTGMNMAEVEARLRDDAFKTALQGAFGEAGIHLDRAAEERLRAEYGLDQSRFGLDQARTELERGSLLDQLARTGLDRAGSIDQLARTGLAQAEAQRGVTSDRMGVADLLRGLSSDRLDQAGFEVDSASSLGSLLQSILGDQAGIYGDASSRAASQALQSAGLLGGVGEMDRMLSQAQLDEYRTGGQQALSWLADIFTGTAIDKGPVGNSTTTQKPSLFQSLLGAAASGAGAALAGSDERIKEGVVPAESGLEALRQLKTYEYGYKDGFGHTRDRTTGVMAQDVERAGITGGVVEIDGVKHVDLYPVLATVVKAVQELDAERRAT